MGLLDFMQKPGMAQMMMGLGSGLLQGAQPGGNLAGGLAAGAQGMLGAKKDFLQQQLVQRKLDLLERQKKMRELAVKGFEKTLGTPGINPIESPVFRSGYNENTGQAPTGMFATNPQMASLLQAQAQIDPEGAIKAAQGLLAPQKEVTPFSTMGKLQADLAAGRISPDQYNLALQNMAPAGMSITMGPDGQFQFSQGPGVKPGTLTPTKKTTSDLQKDIVAKSATLGDLQAIADQYSDSYLTYGGNAKYWALQKMSKAGMDLDNDSKAFLQGATKFRTATDQFFNQYRKEITGAAASVQELELLKKAMFNKDMSPDEFKAAFSQFKDTISRQLEFKRKLASEGIPAKEIGKRIDAGEWRSVSSLLGEADYSAISDDEILKRLSGG